MKIMGCRDVREYVNNQLIFFGGGAIDDALILDTQKDVEKCFAQSANKYYYRDGDIVFDVLHSGQYSIFLWFLSKHLSVAGRREEADKVYCLNKMLHAVDWYYEIDLPAIWGVEHPVGSVLGRAVYGNGLFVYQGTTVGGSNGRYPKLGNCVVLYSNSSILGSSTIGNNVILSCGVTILNEDVPDNSLVFSSGNGIKIVRKDTQCIVEKVRHIWKVETLMEAEISCRKP